MVFQVLSILPDIASIGLDSAYAAQGTNTGSIDAYIQGANTSSDASQIHRDYVDGPSSPSSLSIVPSISSSSSISSVSLVCLIILVVMIL